jgi:hypothetical protein
LDYQIYSSDRPLGIIVGATGLYLRRGGFFAMNSALAVRPASAGRLCASETDGGRGPGNVAVQALSGKKVLWLFQRRKCRSRGATCVGLTMRWPRTAIKSARTAARQSGRIMCAVRAATTTAVKLSRRRLLPEVSRSISIASRNILVVRKPFWKGFAGAAECPDSEPITTEIGIGNRMVAGEP